MIHDKIYFTREKNIANMYMLQNCYNEYNVERMAYF